MNLFRFRFETIRWAIVVIFLAMVLGVGLFTNVTLRSLERSLPTLLLSQIEALTRIMDGLNELTHSAATMRMNPQAGAVDSFEGRVNEVYEDLVDMRRSFVLDNLIQASAFHAVVAPALVDVLQWLEYGVGGHGRKGEVIMTVIHARLREAQARASAVRAESQGLVQTILEEQRQKLDRFLVGVNLLLAFSGLISVLVLGLMWKQHRLWRREAAAMAERTRLTAIIESSRDFISTATLDGRLTYINRFGRALVGWGEDEDLKEKRIDNLHPDRVVDIL
ncbi:MAG: PAS domain S-box protein, partial [Deltaproteobacteria bacterium]|nr:PAS domain S-box protein [Deltaproteobacteria bacterium]